MAGGAGFYRLPITDYLLSLTPYALRLTAYSLLLTVYVWSVVSDFAIFIFQWSEATRRSYGY